MSEEEEPACRKPNIEYPTPWTYRIVGLSEEAVRTHVSELVGEAEHELVHSNASKTGKYVSLALTLTVVDEAYRLTLYQDLVAHEMIKMVL